MLLLLGLEGVEYGWDGLGALGEVVRYLCRACELRLIQLFRTLRFALCLGCHGILGRYLIVLEERFQNLHALFVLLVLEEVADLEHFVLYMALLVIEDEAGLHGLDLGFEEAESVGIRDVKAGANVDGKLFVRFAQFVFAVSIGTVLAEVTHLFLLEVLAHLRLVVVVRDVEHLVLHFDGQLLQNRQYCGQQCFTDCFDLGRWQSVGGSEKF